MPDDPEAAGAVVAAPGDRGRRPALSRVALVGVDRRRDEQGELADVVSHPADEVHERVLLLAVVVDEDTLAVVVHQALVDVAGAPDVILGRLRHEARRDAIQEGDLLDAVLVDRVAVRGGDGVRVAGVDLVLPVPGLALGELDRDACAVHATADRPEVALVHRGGEDVVVEDVGDRRGEVLEVLLPGLRVALLVEVELELGGGVGREAHLPRTLVHGDQDLAGRGDHRGAVVIDDVGENQRGAVEPRDPPQSRHVRGDPEVPVAVLPVRHLVAGQRLHVHVEREQVVAALHPVPDHLVEEVLDLDALAEQPALHVREGGDDGVDRALLGLIAEIVEGEHAASAAGAAGPGSSFLALLP